MTDHTNEPPFGFTLKPSQVAARPDRVLESFVRTQLEGLLDIVVLTSNGEPVDVDGFLWTRDAFARVTEGPPQSVPIFPRSKSS